MKKFKFHKEDLLSGFLVSLLALPLSIGIAKASDFPVIYGLVSAIIGGMIVSFFSGSELSIKGPAAGLIVICSGAITSMGGGEQGWHYALAAITVSGLLQILFGKLKFGTYSDFFSGAAIHGMMAAIGIIIMSKQIHILLGIDPEKLKGLEPFELIKEIPNSFLHENAHLTEIGLASLLILIAFSYIKHPIVKAIPSPLIVLLVAVPLGLVLHVKTEGAVSNFALVKVGSLIDALKKSIINVDFKIIPAQPRVFLEYVVLFSLIGSLESILTVKAIDSLDPKKRISDINKDLIATGIGNTIAGIVGAIPMISEVARSTTNLGNNAQTRWSNFFHGLFLLVMILFLVPVIEMIPNAALAAMLIFVGFKLAHPKEFAHMWEIGYEQFAVFVITIVFTLLTDLLIGIAVGLVSEALIYIYYGIPLNTLFKSKLYSIKTKDDTFEIVLIGSITFINLMTLKNIISLIPNRSKLIVNGTDLKFIDHTCMDTLLSLQKEMQSFNLIGFDEMYPLTDHPKSGKIR